MNAHNRPSMSTAQEDVPHELPTWRLRVDIINNQVCIVAAPIGATRTAGYRASFYGATPEAVIEATARQIALEAL